MNSAELKEKMAALPEPITDKKPPHWEYWRYNLWERVKNYDPTYFHTFPCVYHTMLVNHWKDRVAQEYEEIVNAEGSAMVDYAARMPEEHYTEDFLPGTSLSLNLIHQYYHLFRWHTETGDRLTDLDRIVEFGGGYGAMPLVAYRCGFRGEYYIYDSPEFSLLQQFYLSRVLSEDTFGKVHWNDKRVKICDLLIACYSLSEVTIEERTKFLGRLKVLGYLFLYSNKFAGYDNVAYFDSFAKNNIPDRWTIKPAVHLPPGNWYAFGGI